MEDQYGIPDLRHFVAAGRPFLPPASPPPFPHRSLTTDNLPYYMLNFRSDPAAPAFEPEPSGGAGRWPRQETLTLLEIRSRLDAKFKEANQKGPLWDEVSRIMSEEYGYHRSGKKCREKFENLYKYYKKTKAGKSSRQDGKHYRFFRQLEALYGGDDNQTLNNHNNQEPSNPTLVSISTSSDFDAFVSSDDDSDERKIRRKSLKEKIKESIDSRMKEMMEKQEAWMEKMMRTIEANEQERLAREEQWRRKDVERIEREQRMWAGEKAWIQARDAALMDALTKMVGKEDQGSSRMGPSHHHHHHQNDRESISEQGIDGSSPPDYNAMGDGGFRYFGGDGYGGL